MRKFLKVLLPILTIVLILFVSIVPCFAVSIPEIGEYAGGNVGFTDQYGELHFVQQFTTATVFNHIGAIDNLLTNYSAGLNPSTMGLSALYLWFHDFNGRLSFLRLPTYIGMSQSTFAYTSTIDGFGNLTFVPSSTVNYHLGVLTGSAPQNQSSWTISARTGSYTLNIHNLIFCNDYDYFRIDPSLVFDHFIPSLKATSTLPYQSVDPSRTFADLTDPTANLVWATENFGNFQGPFVLNFDLHSNYKLNNRQLDFILDNMYFDNGGLIKAIVISSNYNRDAASLSGEILLNISGGLGDETRTIKFKVGNMYLKAPDGSTNFKYHSGYEPFTDAPLKSAVDLVSAYSQAASVGRTVLGYFQSTLPYWLQTLILFPLTLAAAGAVILAVIKLI